MICLNQHRWQLQYKQKRSELLSQEFLYWAGGHFLANLCRYKSLHLNSFRDIPSNHAWRKGQGGKSTFCEKKERNVNDRFAASFFPRLQDGKITFPMISKRVDTLHALLLSPYRFRPFIYCSWKKITSKIAIDINHFCIGPLSVFLSVFVNPKNTKSGWSKLFQNLKKFLF